MKRKYTKREKVINRDPSFSVRDPIVESVESKKEEEKEKKRPYKFWNYIPEGNKTVCPKCGHNLRNFGTTPAYIDYKNKKIMRKKECSKCRNKVGTIQEMTISEVEKYCSHAEAAMEYQQDIN